jgi:hypothetical protein
MYLEMGQIEIIGRECRVSDANLTLMLAWCKMWTPILLIGVSIQMRGRRKDFIVDQGIMSWSQPLSYYLGRSENDCL